MILSNILPTSFKCGELRNKTNVSFNAAIIGSGSTGIATIFIA